MSKLQLLNVVQHTIKPFGKLSTIQRFNLKNSFGSNLSVFTNQCQPCLWSSTYIDNYGVDLESSKRTKRRITSPTSPVQRKPKFSEDYPVDLPSQDESHRHYIQPQRDEKRHYSSKPFYNRRHFDEDDQHGFPTNDEKNFRGNSEAETGERKQYHKKPFYNKHGNPVVKTRGEILYGKFPVLIAMKARKRRIHKLFIKTSMFESESSETKHIVDELMSLCQGEDTVMVPASQQYLNTLVKDPVQGLRQHQGICADVSPKLYRNISPTDMLETDAASKTQVWLLVQSVQDPNNFGAILRSAFYLGVDRVLAHNSCKLSPAVSKVSAGALELMDLYNIDDLHSFLQVSKSKDWQILGTAGMKCPSDGVMTLDKVTVNKNTILVLGNEGQGLSTDIRSVCDNTVSILQSQDHPLMESLNVSVATGIILHDLVRKRNQS